VLEAGVGICRWPTVIMSAYVGLSKSSLCGGGGGYAAAAIRGAGAAQASLVRALSTSTTTSSMEKSPSSAGGRSPSKASQSTGSGDSTALSDSAEPEGVEPLSPGTPAVSEHGDYAEASQTIIFLDWDDTLFPTFDLFNTRGLHLSLELGNLPEDLLEELATWREALRNFLHLALEVSDRCTIVTNAKCPWVTNCIDRLAPELKPLFDKETGRISVIYAAESLRTRRFPAGAAQGLSQESMVQFLTTAKYDAMKDEAASFYSKYPGQLWKNIVSVGDSLYERNAVHELHGIAPAGETLRTKAVLVPSTPSLSQIILGLELARVMLPAWVYYDGDIDLDLQSCHSPLQANAESLALPQLSHVYFPEEVWSSMLSAEREEETRGEVRTALIEVSMVVDEVVHNTQNLNARLRPATLAGSTLPPSWV